MGDCPKRVEESLDAWYEDDGRALFLGVDLMEHAPDAPEDPQAEGASESEDEEAAQLEANQARRVEHGIFLLEKEAAFEQQIQEDMKNPLPIPAPQVVPETTMAEPAKPSQPLTLWGMLRACALASFGFHV